LLKPEARKEKEYAGKESEHTGNTDQIQKIRIKVRFDYRGTPRPNRFFFGGKKTEEAAEEIRDYRAELWRNVPLQGVRVEDVQVYDIYTIIEDEQEGDKIAYAPLELILSVDTLEDCLYVIAREEFRTLEVLEPTSITLTSRNLEKILFKFTEIVKQIKVKK